MLNKRLIATTALLGASLIAGFASAQDFGRARGEHARPARQGFMFPGEHESLPPGNMNPCTPGIHVPRRQRT